MLIFRVKEFFDKIKKCKVYVYYAGDFNFQIGPPTSMRKLYLLLSDYDSYASGNLILGKVENKYIFSNEIKEKKSFKKVKKILSLIRLFFIYMKFNFACNIAYLFNKNITIIITQPYLIPFFKSMNVVYIRRANVKASEVLSKDFISCFLEKNAIRINRYKLIYLVKQNEEEKKYNIIPNHFNADDFFLSYHKQKFNIHCVGTWCERKGAEDVISLSKFVSCINVYGGLGDNFDLNNKLINNSNLLYNGVVDKPYSCFNVGDIFISMSKIEGFQRSMVEALLTGCIIIALKRPDSSSIAHYPGVFLVSNIYNCNDIIKMLDDMSYKKRISLGENNRDLAIKDFDRDSVLKLWLDFLEQ